MVYRFELKKQLSETLAWAGVLAGVLWLLLYGFYPVFLDSRSVMEAYLAAFPPQAAAALGFDLEDLFSFQSFSGVVHMYASLLAAVMISTAAISVFAREKKDKCMDFLLTRPQRRPVIFVKKLLCCLTLMLIADLPYLCLYGYSYWDYTGTGSLTVPMTLSLLSLPLTQLVFLSAGIFAAVFLRRVRSAAGMGAGIGLFAFLLSLVYSLTEKEIFRFFSPLYYFSPKTVSETGGYDPACAAAALILTVILTAAAYVKYTRADIPA